MLPQSSETVSLQAFSNRGAGSKGTVEADDLTMAIQARAAFSFVKPPPLEVGSQAGYPVPEHCINRLYIQRSIYVPATLREAHLKLMESA